MKRLAPRLLPTILLLTAAPVSVATADSVKDWGPWAGGSLEEALLASGADITELLEPTAAGRGGQARTGAGASRGPQAAVTPEGLPDDPGRLNIPPGPSVRFANAGSPGVIRGQVIWPAGTGSDIDLVMTAPGGGVVAYYNTRLTLPGGGEARLDYDNTSGAADDPALGAAVENISVNPAPGGTLPAGNYDFQANAFDLGTPNGLPVTMVVTGDSGVTGLQGTQTLVNIGDRTDVFRVIHTPGEAPRYERIPVANP